MTQPASAPLGEAERIAEIDVLRGIALLGVLMVNFVGFAGEHVMATPGQLEQMASGRIDFWANEGVRILVGDKANTVFATLFGLGFYVQLKRAENRPGFERRYARRLFWLLLFGWLNALFLWVWDILNLYAVAGFALLLMRNWSARRLAAVGLLLALYSVELQEWLTKQLSLPFANAESYYSDAAVIERQQLAQAGDYGALVRYFAGFSWVEWILGGMMLAWVIYALGRFALGAAIGRSGLFENLPRHLPLLGRVARIGIPLGIALGVAIRLAVHERLPLPGDPDAWDWLGQILRSPTALILAAGYCAGVLVALQRDWGRRLFGPFGAVGRMALTNYLAQGFLYAFILFGVGPGLALAGRIGTATIVPICLAFFAGQIAFSHWWLARYRFGPMEWLWRTLTYGERPRMRRVREAAAVA